MQPPVALVSAESVRVVEGFSSGASQGGTLRPWVGGEGEEGLRVAEVQSG